MAYLQYCNLTEHLSALERDLSPREMEILNWIARGKSNAVIGDILGLSRHTADTLVRRLFDKLGVADRTTAVIRGLGVARSTCRDRSARGGGATPRRDRPRSVPSVPRPGGPAHRLKGARGRARRGARGG